MVMKSIRKNVKTLLWITAIMFILATFMGLGSYYFSRRGTETVAQVNNKKISIEEFYKTFREHINTYRYVYRMDITDEMMPQLKRSVLEGMIQIKLILEEIKKNKIKVTDKEIIEQIRRNPAFQKNGKFNRQLYIEALKYQRITPGIYEDEIRNSIKSEKIARLITAGAKVTTLELWDEYKRRKYNPDNERDTFEARKGMMTDFLISEKKNLYYREWLNHIRNKANITNNLAKIDPEVK